MRHVTRTHRVDLDRLFERINLGANMPIRCVNPPQHFLQTLPMAHDAQNLASGE